MQISIPGGPSSEEANYEDENEDIEIVDLKIIPSSAVPAPTSTTSETSAATQLDSTTESPIQRFFAAISTCSNLHPDPIPGGGGLSTDDDIQDGNEDEDDPIIFEGSVGYESILMPRSSGITTLADTSSMPPPMPGSSGWITAENVNEFFDEEGNFKGRDGDDDEEEELRLGPGAGSIRTRDEDVDVEGGLEDAEGGRDGSGREVAGETEEMETSQTKWRRTG
ncbi:MAG: hypothetical protein M1823_000825 [Watsoniomyces obsoletus]|nr:MAG: hypothetical protein M1823_000825 [Watsoniomyces obsoletus]